MNENAEQPVKTINGKIYIGTKIIRAEPMDYETWARSQNKWQENQETLGVGYQVQYDDGYISWSPKAVFERCYRELSLDEYSMVQRRPTKERVLTAPAKHHLIACFKELKFGRPVEDQKYLQRLIDEMADKHAKMNKFMKPIKELIETGECPLPLEVIPNKMGINLVSVESIAWEKQDDGQLVNLTINFIPSHESGN